MLNEKIVELMNKQINKELESAYLYLAFSNYFAEKGLLGFAHWYNVQAREEVEHAEKFIDYMHDEGESVELYSIELVDANMEDDLEVLKEGLNHERYVTGLINWIYKEASDLEDFRTMEFLNWFIKEQQEEEINAMNLLVDYQNKAMCDDCCKHCGAGLSMMDRDLAKRL